MPKAKPIGYSVDTYTYKPRKAEGEDEAPKPYTCYRVLWNGESVFESNTSQTRDYVLSCMQQREAGKVEKVAENLNSILLDKVI